MGGFQLRLGRAFPGPAQLESPPKPLPPVTDRFDQALDLDAARNNELAGELCPSEVLDAGQAASLVQQMLRASLAFFASEVVRGDVTSAAPKEGEELPDHHGQTIIGEHHEEWCEIVRKNSQSCIIAPRDHGKCSPAGHLILRSDGTRVPIEQWQGGEVLAFDPRTLTLVPAQASPVHSNGRKRCLRIRTRTGREETVTLNHPLRTLNEWRRADRLRVGDRIAVPRELAIDGKHSVEDAWLLGALIGDGSVKVSTVVGICMTEPSMIDAVRAICSRRGWTLNNSTDNDFRLTNDWRRKGSAQEWIADYGLTGQGSHTKRVPEAIFTAPREDVAEFVAGYLDTDGSVNPHGGGCVTLGSVSRELLRDTQHLLIRLGVVSVLNRKRGTYKGQPHWSWALHIRGKSILRLAKWVRLRNRPRAEALAEVVRLQEQKLEGGSIDLLPREIYARLERSADWHRQRGLRFDRKYGLTRTKALALAQAEENAELEKIANAEILWDEILEIEDVGEHETYFITVPGLESYVGDDIVNHNSHLLTIAPPIWEGWRRPGCEIAIFSETQPQAEKQLAKLKREIETNPRLQHLQDPNCWSAKLIRFANGTTIYACGFGTKTRGMHPHLIVCDDIVSERAAYSALVRQRQADTFFGALRSMLVPGGKLVVVGTPQHAEDLYGLLERNPEWHFVRYSAIDRKTGKILFPQRYDEQRLLARKREIGEIRFTREFLGLPVSSGMSLIPDEFVSGVPFMQDMVRLGPVLEDGSPARAWWMARGVTRFYAGVDIAISANIEADYFVIFIVGLDDFGNRWVVDIFREKGLDYKSQKAKIAEKSRMWRCELVCIESNQTQKIYGNELKEDTDVPVYQYTTLSEKHSLERGIPSLRVLFENRKYRCPRGDENSIIETDTWIGEMQGWTFSDGKVESTTRHDDIAMAMWMCEQAIGKGEAFTFAMGEQPGDAELAAQYEAEEQALLAGADDPWVLWGLDQEELREQRPETKSLNFDGSAQDRERPVHPLGGRVPTFKGM